MILAQDIVEIALPQMAIIHARRDGQRTCALRRDVELDSEPALSARLDGVVISDGMNGPHFVVIDEIRR